MNTDFLDKEQQRKEANLLELLAHRFEHLIFFPDDPELLLCLEVNFLPHQLDYLIYKQEGEAIPQKECLKRADDQQDLSKEDQMASLLPDLQVKQVLRSQREQNVQRCSLALSVWRIEKENAFQIDEHQLFNCRISHLYPKISKPFFSNDKQRIFLYFQELVEKKELAQDEIYLHKLSVFKFEKSRIVKEHELNISEEVVKINEIIDSEDLTHIQAIWKSEYLYVHSQKNHFFMKVDGKNFQVLQRDSSVRRGRFKVEDYDIPCMFLEDEAQKGQRYIYSLEKSFKEDKTKFSMKRLDFKDIGKLDIEEALKPVNGYQFIIKGQLKLKIALQDRELKEIVLITTDDKFYFFSKEYEKQEVLQMNFGSDFKFRRNCHLYSDFVGVCYDEDSRPNIFSMKNYVKNRKLHFFMPTNTLGSLETRQKFDICIKREKEVYEAAASSEYNGCIKFKVFKVGEENDSPSSLLAENSAYQFHFPYLTYCKGSDQMVMRNIQKPDQFLKLMIDDNFYCFTEVIRLQVKEVERIYEEFRRDYADQFDQLGSSESCQKIFYISKDKEIEKEIYHLNCLLLFPYYSFTTSRAIHLKAKLCEFDLFLPIKVYQSMLGFLLNAKRDPELHVIAQYKEQIASHKLKEEKTEVYPAMPLYAIFYEEESTVEAVFGFQEKLGCNLKIFSSLREDKNREKSSLSEQSTSILNIMRRGDSDIFILEDSLTLKQFRIRRNNKGDAFHLQPVKNLELDTLSKAKLTEQRQEYFSSFVLSYVTNADVLLVQNEAYKYFEDQSEIQRNYEMIKQLGNMNSVFFEKAFPELHSKEMVVGPIRVDPSSDRFAFFFASDQGLVNRKKRQEREDELRRSLKMSKSIKKRKSFQKSRSLHKSIALNQDAQIFNTTESDTEETIQADHYKKSLIIVQAPNAKQAHINSCKINFCTFLPDKNPQESQILFQVDNRFYVMSENGTIKFEVGFPNQDKLKQGENLVVEDVSLNTKFFLINGKIYEYVKKDIQIAQEERERQMKEESKDQQAKGDQALLSAKKEAEELKTVEKELDQEILKLDGLRGKEKEEGKGSMMSKLLNKKDNSEIAKKIVESRLNTVETFQFVEVNTLQSFGQSKILSEKHKGTQLDNYGYFWQIRGNEENDNQITNLKVSAHGATVNQKNGNLWIMEKQIKNFFNERKDWPRTSEIGGLILVVLDEYIVIARDEKVNFINENKGPFIITYNRLTRKSKQKEDSKKKKPLSREIKSRREKHVVQQADDYKKSFKTQAFTIGIQHKVKFVKSSEWTLKRLVACSSPDTFQLELVRGEKETAITSVITWNLRTNLEESSYEISQDQVIVRGANSVANFTFRKGDLIDLEYSFPLKFYQVQEDFQRDFRENVVSQDKSLLLFKSERGLKTSKSASYWQLKLLKRLHKNQNRKVQDLPLEIVDFRMKDGSNIFHFILAQNDFHLLQKFEEEYTKYSSSFEDEEDITEAIELYCLLLYPSNPRLLNKHNFKTLMDSQHRSIKGIIEKPKKEKQTGFLCFKKKAKKQDKAEQEKEDQKLKYKATSSPFQEALALSNQFAQETLLILSKIDCNLLSRQIFQEPEMFKQLLRMRLDAFPLFLQTCQMKTPTLRSVQYREWIHGEEEEHLFYATSSLVGEDQMSKELGKAAKADHEKAQEKEGECPYEREKKFSSLDCEVRDKKASKVLEQSGKRLKLSFIELDWIFKGDSGKMFVEQLSQTKFDKIFESEIIRICVEFLWDNFYFKRLFLVVLLPYLLYFGVFIFYSSYLYDGSEITSESYGRYFCGSCCLAFSFFFFVMEYKQLFAEGFLAYFSQSSALFWNIVDFLSLIMVCALVVGDFMSIEYRTGRGIASMACLLLWIKLFQFMRIFKKTAAFIRMITEIIMQMGIFAAIFFIGIIAHANAFFILDGGTSKDTGVWVKDEDSGELVLTRLMGENWIMTIINTYITAIGDFGSDYYSVSEHSFLVWFFFVSCVVLVQILLLNLLIALMGDTFDKVQEIKEQANLKEVCRLMAENWLYMDQKSVFRKCKYIFVAQVEKADQSAQEWEGKLASIKKFLTMEVEDFESSLKNNKSQQKEEMNQLQKSMQQRILMAQSHILKQTGIHQEYGKELIGKLADIERSVG